MSALDDIRARVEAATPGPWKLTDEAHAYYLGSAGYAQVGWLDALFIAHARTDIPALLAAVDAVLALADMWRERGEHLRDSVKQYPEDVRETLEDDAADFLHKSDLVRAAVTRALEGQA